MANWFMEFKITSPNGTNTLLQSITIQADDADDAEYLAKKKLIKDMLGSYKHYTWEVRNGPHRC